MRETIIDLDLGENSPVQIHIASASPQTVHWHNHIELFYVLEGKLKLSIAEREYTVAEDNIFLINPLEMHIVQDDSAKVAVFSIQHTYFEGDCSLKNVWYECNSMTSKNQEGIIRLKKILARFIKINADGYKGHEFLNKSMCYSLMDVLTAEFTISHPVQTINSHHFLRMKDILQYTNEHYDEHITLSDIAEKYYLTVPYMSKFFKTMMGTTFTEYMCDLRLSHVVSDLSQSDITTEKLAEVHGFPNTRSLVTAFRAKYQKTPMQYKRHMQMEKRQEATETYLFSASHTNYLGVLSKYLTDDEQVITRAAHTVVVKDIPEINVTAKQQLFKHYYQKSCALGRAKEILLAENQNVLKNIQEKIGFEYLCFHGLLDDDMMLYSEDSYGNPELSFSLVDAAFDFLKKIHLRPVIELSFMPSALAQTQNQKKAFSLQSIIALPKDMDKWCYLIEKLIEHLMNRYGDSEVETWPIYLWNTPDLEAAHLGREGMEDYYELYMETYKTVKNCNPRLQFGSPNFTNLALETGNYLEEFTEFSKKNKCMPDFIGMNYFPMTSIQEFSNTRQAQTNLLMRVSPDTMRETFIKIKEKIKELGLSDRPLYVMEWNSTISHRELLNDTAFKSAYIVKNILESYGYYNHLTYWALTDLLEEIKLSGNQFHGGLGMFTFDGIPKAAYYAYEILSQLGDRLISRGDGYCVTKTSTEWQIILYNYHHYSTLYASGELFDMTMVNRYTPFLQEHLLRVNLLLSNMEDGKYTLFETIINKQHGSSFDKWVELGAETLVDEREQQYLYTSSVPKMHRRKLETHDGKLEFQCELEAHEVRLIKIRRHYD